MSLLGALISSFAFKAKNKATALRTIEETASSPEKDSRVLEAQAELKRQAAIAKWQGRAATSLTFSQYIVGGVLATSFIQENLTQGLVGLMGLLVLVSSLIRQHFRPDLQSRYAKERVVTLRNLIRQAEDGLFAIKNGKSEPEEIHNIRDYVTRTLREIEISELQAIGKIDAETGS
jgi:hypothetical protein